MSINRINPDDVEVFTLETHPRRMFSSSSISGSDGELYVFPRRSSVEKEVQPLSLFSSSVFSDEDMGQYISLAQHFATVSGTNEPQVDGYLSAVFDQQASARRQQQVSIHRFTPPYRLNKNTLRKSVAINSLMPFYRATQPNAHYAFSNYHSLNWFHTTNLPEASALIYPNKQNVSGALKGVYSPTGSWSFDFWINPRLTTDSPNGTFKAGTIMHLSGVFAVSLVTGSSRDINGYTDGYRILLQMSSSANTPPSIATPNNLTIFSSDNALKRNQWHHVTIRHGGPAPLYNNGTGSICINTKVDTTFVLTSSIVPTSFGSTDGPCALVVGNYYEGTNTSTDGLTNFFAADTAAREGLEELSSLPSIDYPSSFFMNHPLNAEIHELKIYNKYLTSSDIDALHVSGPQNLNNILFYLPPFFTEMAPTQSYVNGRGGVLLTPFQTKTDTTKDAFNVSMSFGVGGMYMNLENFTMDIANKKYPRLLNMTASALGATSDTGTANEFLFSTGSNNKRQYLIMPCDNGLFTPNFTILEGFPNNKYRNDLGNLNYGFVTLRDLVPLSNPSSGLIQASGSIVDDLVGVSPENIGGVPSDSLAVLHRTRDNTSNQSVFFDISNLYYGNEIKPGSLTLTDSSISGSFGKVKVTLRDDGQGNLYRADSDGPHSTWSSVGNVFYSEGIVLIKAPELFFFGENKWDIEFKGSQNLHVMKFNLAKLPLTSLSSSNPSFIPNSPSDLANNTDESFVWLTGVYLHDDNLNVIAKTHTAQPIQMKDSDKIMFKIKMDF